MYFGDGPDKLEEAAISELGSGTDEVWQGLSDGTWRLVAALRTEDICFHCHGQKDGERPQSDKEPLGYVSVKLTCKLSGE